MLGTLLHCWWECKLYNHYGNQYGSSSKNWESIYLKTLLYHSWAYTQRTFHSTKEYLLNYVHCGFIDNNWNLETNRCLASKDWIRKCGTFTQWTITQVLKSDIMKFADKWVELEKNHPQKDKHGMYSLISGY